MRISPRLIFLLLAAAILVSFVSAYFQFDMQRSRCEQENDQRLRLLAATLQQIVRPLLNKDATAATQKLIDQFSSRQHLTGVVVYDSSMRVLSLSTNLPPATTAELVTPLAQEALKSGTERQTSVQVADQNLSTYVMPIRSPLGGTSHVLVLLHDTSWTQKEFGQFLFYTLGHVLAQAILLVLVILVVIRWNILQPLTRAVNWMRQFRHGSKPEARLLPRGNIFNPLAKEIVTFARQLHIAQTAAEQEARLRQTADSLWTPERLKEHVRVKLDGRPLIVISNREPYKHQYKGREIEVVVPASGVVTALDPVMKACGGTWIAHGETDADWAVVDSNDSIAVPPEQPLYTLKRVHLTQEEEKGYYYGFSNEGMWPLCHLAHVQPIFRPDDWQAYQTANYKFAQAVLQVIADQPEPCILIQDFHFALLPRLLKQARQDARIAIFWHVPWPNPESFGICPWEKELLDGMLGADLIGFHTQYHCNNFLHTTEEALECRVDWEHFSIERQQHFSKVKPFPISVAYPPVADILEEESTPEKTRAVLAAHGIKTPYIGLGVERMDYTKGIRQRFHALERFFKKYPDFIGQFTFMQIGAPSRTTLKEYNDYSASMTLEAERINTKFKTSGWKPIVFLNRHHSQKEILPLYKVADLCTVTSLHDGMNLVAKEFVAARDDESGALILSQFTGASRELKDALIVNPYDIDQLADAMYQALTMDPTEKQARMRNLRLAIAENNIYRWAGSLIEELTRIRISGEASAAPADLQYV